MKKRILGVVGALLLSLSLCACGNTPASEAGANTEKTQVSEETVTDTAGETEAVAEVSAAEPQKEEAATEKVAEEKEEATVKEEAAIEEVKDESTDIEAKVTAFESEKEMYANKACNIRKGPGTEYDLAGHATLNQKLTVTGKHENGWYQIKLGEEFAYISGSLVSETEVAEAIVPVLPSPAVAATQATANTQVQAAATAPAKTVTAPAGVLIIGDSRCVQMREAVAGGGCSWICKNGARYEWFSETAIPQADNMVGKGTKVVICMGVNDPGNYSKYASLTNLKTLEWTQRGAKVYYVSVNPVWENPYTSEDQVMNFNAGILPQLMGVKWIDTHSYLVANGYKMVDGLHYDTETSTRIFFAIIGSL